MNAHRKRWSAFNTETLTPLDQEEISEIKSGCDSFNERFNNVLAEKYRYQWSASPLNLGNLDYDFYEFGGGHWYSDNGYGFTCAWGEILVTSFGFQWMKMEGAKNLRDWVLKHEEAFYVFFPWQTLWSIVESAGNQFTKAEGAWMRILKEVDSVYPLPDGWHPAIDAMTGHASLIPSRVVSELEKLYHRTECFFERLGLSVYDWGSETDWEQVETHLKLTRKECN